MGRSPCCDKLGLKKGPWTPEEDQKLLAYIEEHGHGSWRVLPAKAGLQRCGKSCRLRWTNYLRPDIKRGKFSLQEEQTIIQLHALLGNRWSAIATHLPKRTDNEIKNYWNTRLKKRLDKMGIDPATHKPKKEALLSSDCQSKHAANLSHMAQWESARLEAETRLVRQSKLRSITSHNQPFTNTSEFASPSVTSPLNKPIVSSKPPRFVDILKAMSSVWTKPNEAGPPSGAVSVTGIDNVDLESPTSTLSYSENATRQVSSNPTGKSSNAFIEICGDSSGSSEARILKEEGEQHWKRFGSSMSFTSELDNMTMPIESACTLTQGTTLTANVDHVASGNFMDKFTDLLLSGSGGRSFSEGDGDTDHGGSGGTGTDSEYCGDGNNYWSSILNLVDSSASDSPVF